MKIHPPFPQIPRHAVQGQPPQCIHLINRQCKTSPLNKLSESQRVFQTLSAIDTELILLEHRLRIVVAIRLDALFIDRRDLQWRGQMSGCFTHLANISFQHSADEDDFRIFLQRRLPQRCQESRPPFCRLLQQWIGQHQCVFSAARHAYLPPPDVQRPWFDAMPENDAFVDAFA